MAAAIHGVVRASMDADAILSVSSHRLREIEEAFRVAGFETELRHGDSDDPISAVLVLGDAVGNRVDLLVGLRGFEPAAFSRVVEVSFHGEILHVVGLEDFVSMKLFAGGPQDLSDARYALAAAGESLDMALLKRLTARFGRGAEQALESLLANK
ncbi:MAG TPA: hypothetical protein VFY39_09420 [Gammaproteobacteria bacterium]|nr:hypothetical protein [Gammaproteobacteria bacterium]